MSVQERLPKIQRWHKRFRQLLREPRYESEKVVEGSAWIEPASASTEESAEEAESESASSRTNGESAEEAESHTKWGRFLLHQRWNSDQVPLGFVSGQDSTWEERGSKRVHIAQPFPGLEKRQCTVQPTISPGDRTMLCAIIFRGKGHVSKIEKQAYDKRVDVYFQSHAWADSDFCMQWARRTFQEGLKGEDGKLPAAQSLLLMDNLHGQTTEEFKTYLHKFCNTLLWHLPAGCTDEVQPIDAGYGRLLKVYTGQALDEWLGHGENLQKWECNALTASERRVLITKWVGEATERIDKLPYHHEDGRTSREDTGVPPLYRHRLFEKTGTAMTADGTGDDKISLEGLEEGFRYTFMDVEDQNGDVGECGPVEQQNSGHGDGGNSGSGVEGHESHAEEDQNGNGSSDEESDGAR